MLDVLHFMFEEDLRFTTPEEAKGQSKMRTQLYSLYGRSYKYGSGDSGTTYGGRAYVPDDLDSVDVTPVSVKKAYVPPTKFNPESTNPFGSVLDAPLN